MRQRVIIALSLVLSPKLLIADEPTSALDVVTQREILSLLKQQVVRRNLSLIFITHEISLLPNLVDYVAVMYRGEIVEHGPVDKVLKGPMHPYTEMLLSTLMTGHTTLSQLSSSPAEESQKGSESRRQISSTSCRYADRCRYAFSKCIAEKPDLKLVEEGRSVSCHKYN